MLTFDDLLWLWRRNLVDDLLWLWRRNLLWNDLLLNGVISELKAYVDGVIDDLNGVPNDLWTVLENLRYVDNGVIYDQFDNGVADFDGVPNDLDGVPNDQWTVLKNLSNYRSSIDDGVKDKQFHDGVNFGQCVDNGFYLWRSGYLWDSSPIWVISPATAFLIGILRSASFCSVICGVILTLADVASVGKNSGWAFHLGGVYRCREGYVKGDIHTNILAHTLTQSMNGVSLVAVAA